MVPQTVQEGEIAGLLFQLAENLADGLCVLVMFQEVGQQAIIKERLEHRKDLGRKGVALVNGLNMQKCQISKDKQEVNRAEAFPLADAGTGEMRLDVQHGKQFLEPQSQIGPELFQSRFDLALKVSKLFVTLKTAPFLWFLVIDAISYLTTNLGPSPLLFTTI